MVKHISRYMLFWVAACVALCACSVAPGPLPPPGAQVEKAPDEDFVDRFTRPDRKGPPAVSTGDRIDSRLNLPVISELSEIECPQSVLRGTGADVTSVCFKFSPPISTWDASDLFDHQVRLIEKSLNIKTEFTDHAAWTRGCSRIALADIPSADSELNWDEAPDFKTESELMTWAWENTPNSDVVIEIDRTYWCEPGKAAQSIAVLPGHSMTVPGEVRIVDDCKGMIDSDLLDEEETAGVREERLWCVRTGDDGSALLHALALQLAEKGIRPTTDDYYGTLRFESDCVRFSIAPFFGSQEAPWRSATLVMGSEPVFQCKAKPAR